MEHNVVINGFELSFSVYDPSFLKRFERSIEQLKKANGSMQGTTDIAEAIELNCRMVFDFFEGMFGSDIANAIFGEHSDIFCYFSCLDKFLCSIDSQLHAFQRLSDKYAPLQNV